MLQNANICHANESLHYTKLRDYNRNWLVGWMAGPMLGLRDKREINTK